MSLWRKSKRWMNSLDCHHLCCLIIHVSKQPSTHALERILAGRAAAFLRPLPVLAVGCEDGSVHMVARESGAILRSITWDSGFVCALAYAPSGRQLAVGCADPPGPGSLHLVCPESCAILLSRIFLGAVELLAYAPSGRYLMVGCPDGIVCAVAAESGVLIWTVQLEGTPCYINPPPFAYAPSGGYVAVGGNEGLYMVDPESGGIIREVLLKSGSVFSLVHSGGGQHLVAGFSNGALHTVAPESGKVIRTTHMKSGAVLSLASAPNGQHFVAGCENGSLHIVASLSGAIVRTVRLTVGRVRALLYAPSGEELAAGGSIYNVGKPLHLLDSETGATIRLIALDSDAAPLQLEWQAIAYDF